MDNDDNFVCQDAASGKVAGLPQSQWQNLPTSAGFSASHSKAAAESSSWEDLVAIVKGAGKLVVHIVVVTCNIFLAPTSTWPYLNSDVGLEEGEY